MAQVFDRGLVLALKIGTLLAVATLATLLFAWRWNIDYPHAIGSAPHQPLPFSHQHHVRDDGIDCRYCHVAVEQSAYAGMPSTEICMSCHSQLFRDVALFEPLHRSMRTGARLLWTRVHDLPDFVYFDHSAHVSHGVACQQCHGRIDEMPLTHKVHDLDMQWCLSCHRDPAKHLSPRAALFTFRSDAAAGPAVENSAELLRQYHVLSDRILTDCSTCHR